MRKRTVAVTGLLALIFGFLLGTIVPPQHLPWSVSGSGQPGLPVQSNTLFTDSSSSSESDPPDSSAHSGQPSALNSKDNGPLLNTAYSVLQAIQQRDYSALASFVHPERGLTFTPYSTVNLEMDLTFTAAQVASFDQDETRYLWGVSSGTGEMIQMTAKEFFSSYIFNVDYTQASRIGVDWVNITGNALENAADAYPGCRFIDFTYPGADPVNQGQDWSSLKLVFAPSDSQWLLVGLIHSQWTA